MGGKRAMTMRAVHEACQPAIRCSDPSNGQPFARIESFAASCPGPTATHSGIADVVFAWLAPRLRQRVPLDQRCSSINVEVGPQTACARTGEKGQLVQEPAAFSAPALRWFASYQVCGIPELLGVYP